MPTGRRQQNASFIIASGHVAANSSDYSNFIQIRVNKARIWTSSSAVAKRPHDASYRSIVSVIASIVQYLERSFFIISYFDFKFTSTYNLILFLRRNVEPWFIHTIHGRPWMSIARDHAWSVSRCTQSWTTMIVYSSLRLVVQYPEVNRKPVAECKIQTRVQQLLIAKPNIRRESRF